VNCFARGVNLWPPTAAADASKLVQAIVQARGIASRDCAIHGEPRPLSFASMSNEAHRDAMFIHRYHFRSTFFLWHGGQAIDFDDKTPAASGCA
jgi:hypothetical protein